METLTVSQAKGEEVANSFGKYLLERQQELGLSDDETAYLAGSMFGAGSDTTASAISIGVLAAACYPEAQAKVQEELDAVIGRNRGMSVSIKMYSILTSFSQHPPLPTKIRFLRQMHLSWKLSDGDLLPPAVCTLSPYALPDL